MVQPATLDHYDPLKPVLFWEREALVKGSILLLLATASMLTFSARPSMSQMSLSETLDDCTAEAQTFTEVMGI